MVQTPPWAPRAAPPTSPLSDVTRYLCAGAYLDTVFRNKVMDELLGDPRRAVAPSPKGFDIGPVIRHCLRARDLLLVRDLLLLAVIVVGLIADFALMLPWLALLAMLSLATVHARSLPPQLRSGSRYGVVTLGVVAITMITALAFYLTTLRPRDPYAFPYAESDGDAAAVVGWLLVVATLAITVGYRVLIGTILARELAPGAATGPGRPLSPALAARVGYVTSAQYSDLTLYSGERPFVGAGKVQRAWSIAVELDRRASSPERPMPDIDPNELYAFVRGRLAQMRDEVANPAESLTLHIGDHVIAQGVINRLAARGAPHPLLDGDQPIQALGRPAIRAIIHHPKAGMRYYQRITIDTAGDEIVDDDGVLVMPAEDQEVVVSAFVHLAVEGRMLYTEFIVTVLPPVPDAYHIVDRLPADPVRMAASVLGVLRMHLFRDIVAAPFRVLRYGYAEMRQAFARARRDDHVLYDYGARDSVRELGSAEGDFSYLQNLDSFKYSKLIGERLNAAVLDFLESHGIDTSRYRQQMLAIVNNSTMISGGTFTGNIAVGAQATVNAPTATT